MTLGDIQIPPEIFFGLLTLLFGGLLYFIRMWLGQRMREERHLQAEIELLREAWRNLESRVSIHDDSLREGRISFQRLREDISGKTGKELCGERHDNLDKIVGRMESTLESLRKDFVTNQQALLSRVDKLLPRKPA